MVQVSQALEAVSSEQLVSSNQLVADQDECSLRQLLLDGLALHQLVERQAAWTPDAIAVIHEGTTLTYQALNQQANQLAHQLVELGVSSQQLVAISLVRSPSMIVAFLGVLKAGAAYVPIDPDYPEVRRQYILNDASVKIVLTQASLAAEFSNASAQIIQLDADAAVLAEQPVDNLDLAISPDRLAYVIYTSGSTGKPKGVMAHHRGLVNYSLALVEALALTATDRMLQFSTMSFDFIVSEVYPTLAVGGCLVLRTDDMMRSTQAFIDFIAAQQVTVIQFTTAFWHELVNGLDRLGLTLPPSLRLLLFGGEKASLAACRRWIEKVGDYPRLFNAYGPTEATVITTLYDAIAEGYDAATDLPIGRAILNAKTYVLDENRQPVAPGVAGELYIGGPGVTRGYLNLPEKTAQAFCDDPFNPGERLYKTGDRVQMDASGLIQFVGRVDFQVKIRGYRIELGEIESCLDQYPHFQARIVIAREDTPGDKRLVAYVVMKPGETLDRKGLQTFMSKTLPAFMVPSAVVVLAALPKNANGKIDRKALPIPSRLSSKQASNKQASSKSASGEQAAVLPRSPLETRLVEIWQRVLCLNTASETPDELPDETLDKILDETPDETPNNTLSVTDNFFDLGGNSLLVMRLFSELEAAFSCRLPLTDIFEAPTIEQLAKRLEQVMNEPVSELMSLVGRLPNEQSSEQSSEQPNEQLNERPEKRPATLLVLRAGKVSPPLFLVHDADGDTGLYLHLARRLKSDRAIYVIGPRTADDAPLAYSRIQRLAADYVEQIRQMQPQGPYCIGGLCAGGVVAFEIGLQLEQLGETVVLALMDTPAPGARKRLGRVATQRLANLGQSLTLSNGVKTSFLERVQKVWRKGSNLLRYEISLKGKKDLSFTRARIVVWYQDRHLPVPIIVRGLSVRELLIFAYEQYKPRQKFAGKLLLLRATQGNGTNSDRPYVEEYADPLLGWQSFCQGAIAPSEVPGGHSTMLSDKNASALASAIEDSLPAPLP
ncbi:MAG: amino acid adenylation domain-containing protein [Phormidesmis sp.]